MRTSRRITQVVCLAAFFALFLFARYPLESKIPVDLFLRMDPLTGISAVLSSRSIPEKIFAGLIVLAVTVLFGRLFCGWICPMGATIDGSDRFLKALPENVKPRHKRLRGIKFALLIGLLSAGLFSVQIAGYLDPIPLFTRTVNAVLYPLFAFSIDGWMGFLLSLGILENAIFSFHEFLRVSILPVSPVAFRGSLLIGIFFLVILLLSKVQKRFWCRNLCPLGALLAVFSKFRWYRRIVTDSCTSCKRCQTQCRMGAIQPDFKGTDHTECINCMDCRKICPARAVRFGFAAKPSPARVDFSRRQMLGGMAGGVLTLGLIKTGFVNGVKRGKAVRPPGAVEESDFMDLCVRCGECVRICSTSGKGLQHSGLETGWEGLGTPMLHSPEGYCEYNCNLCGKVCPTGAIPSLAMRDKQKMKMGTAHFDKSRCIPWYYGEDCMVCEEHCPVSDKAIQFRNTKVTTIDGRPADVLLPFVVENACIGCGICVKCCPLEAEKGIFLTTAGETRSSLKKSG